MASNPRGSSYATSIDSRLEQPTIAAIRRELPDLADEILVAIQREVPGYSRPLSGDFGRGIRAGVELALSRFIGEGEDESRVVYRQLGYGELTAGRSLDALQSAYRVGARVAWQRMSQVAAENGATAESQRLLAEAMFAYIEHIAAESIEGYAEAQLARAGDLERRRGALFEKLTSSPPADRATLAAAATEADWRIPSTLACLALEGSATAAVVRRLSGDSLHGQVGQWSAIIVPDPSRVEHEARAIAARLGIVIGLGPSVPAEGAHLSMRWASLARELPGNAGELLVAERRLAEIALRASPDIVLALAEQVLAPLSGESARSRRRLEETLDAWLRAQGSQRAVASRLGVHPQTVRYRLRRIRELFGTSLEDPDRRFEMEIALRDRLPSARAHDPAAAR